MYARVAKNNIGSIRVLEKCGFTVCRGLTQTPATLSDDVEELFYVLHAANGGFEAQQMPVRSQPESQFTMIERLNAGEGERLRAIRLRALDEAPDAFATTLAEAAAEPADGWDRQLEQLATFVATVGGVDVGLARCARHDHLRDTGYLISLWVAPEARRHGIASDLVDAVVEWARVAGLRRLLLDVAEWNASATALYTRKGFVPNGTFGTLPSPREHIREIQLELRL
jgi:ribosomal protein S18 acetylase RimI-like enzyme